MLNHLFGSRVDDAIERLREYEQFTEGKGYYLAFSGGKDSCVIKALADMAGVKYDAHYNMTTIDPPELVYFIREHHKDVECHKPKVSLLNQIRTRGMPMRMGRWCCDVLKEKGGDGRLVMTGVRWSESPRRAKRKMVETCYRDEAKRYLHPIIDWAEDDVWEFLKTYEVPYCSLYDEGFERLGCLFCPMASPKAKRREYERYPKFAQAFMLAFEDLKSYREANGKTSCDRWCDGKDMFEWWISNQSSKEPEYGGLFG